MTRMAAKGESQGNNRRQDRIIYLNNAATSWPKPPGVIDAVTESLTHPFGEAGRATATDLVDYPCDCRNALARFFSVSDPDSFVFTANATHALNQVIHGFSLSEKERFHVITSDLEHNSVLRPLNTLKRNGKIDLSIVRSQGGTIRVADLESLIEDTTRLAVLTHGSNVLGTVQDIGSATAMFRKEDIFCVIDGSQTAGQCDINLGRLDPDAFIFTGHKYLFGIPGIGGACIRSPDRIEPSVQGGTGFDSANPFHPDTMPEKFEAGTPNYPGIAGLLEGVRYLEGLGMDRVMQEGRIRARVLVEGLLGCDPIILHSTDPVLPVISFRITNMNNDDAGFILRRRYGIISRVGLHCAPLIHRELTEGKGSIRLSPSILTPVDDCRYAVECIRQVSETCNLSDRLS